MAHSNPSVSYSDAAIVNCILTQKKHDIY